ncbi:MAG: hypothetical protein CMP40_00815 [Rickettsiales bacterium]|nr:hypothetical protein [Rickettsiales bacterium]
MVIKKTQAYFIKILLKSIYILIVLNFSLLVFTPNSVIGNDTLICKNEIRKTEERLNIPKNLLLSIALTESGKKINGNFIPWPWTINTKGKGQFFKNKNQVIAKVKNNLKNKKNNFDVGCMQINYYYHGSKFMNIEEMLDPSKNVLYSGKFIIQLKNKHKNWKEAISRYHSNTPWRKEMYFSKVMNNWAFLERDITNNEIMVSKLNKKKKIKLTTNSQDLNEIENSKFKNKKKNKIKNNYSFDTNYSINRDNLKEIRLNNRQFKESVEELSNFLPKNVKRIMVINEFQYMDEETIIDNLKRIEDFKKNKN